MKAVSGLLLAALATLAALVPRATAVDILFRNECGVEMILSNGKTAEKIKKDGVLKKTLAIGAVEAFRSGKGGQATLAEFSIKETTTWYDIGIIPTGKFIGPGNCSSLADCKAVTGGTGYNVAMKIVPGLDDDEVYHDMCMTLNCFADGCPDAYHHPHDPNKTRNCPSTVHFTVVFCATPSTSSLDGSLGWSGISGGALESGVVNTSTPTPTTGAAPGTAGAGAGRAPSTSPTQPPHTVSTSHGSDGGDGGSVAVIVASIIGGFVTVFAAIILVRRWRFARLEKMNDPRYSSEAMVYVEAKDHRNAL